MLVPGERPVIAERSGANTSKVLIAVAGIDSVGRPTLRATAREYDWSQDLVAVEKGFPSPVMFQRLATGRAPRLLSPATAADLQQLRESCASAPPVSGAD